jgi:hypothetical protein
VFKKNIVCAYLFSVVCLCFAGCANTKNLLVEVIPQRNKYPTIRVGIVFSQEERIVGKPADELEFSPDVATQIAAPVTAQHMRDAAAAAQASQKVADAATMQKVAAALPVAPSTGNCGSCGCGHDHEPRDLPTFEPNNGD